MWHDCDEHCQLLHSALLAKTKGILRQARTFPRLTKVRLDSWLNLHTFGPASSGGEKKSGSMELFVVLEWDDMILLKSMSRDGLRSIPTGVRSIVLEQWKLTHEDEAEKNDHRSPSMVEFEKNAIILMRSIYSLARLLPAFNLLSTFEGSELCDKSVYIKTVSSADITKRPFVIRLEESIHGEGTFESTSFVSLAPIVSPHGKFTFSVRYRRQCEFKVSRSPILYAQATMGSGEIAMGPSSFENVELEVASSLLLKTIATPRHSSLGSRSKSSQTIVASPLAMGMGPPLPNCNRPELTTGLLTSRQGRRTGSTLVEDSKVVAFIQHLDRRITISEESIKFELPIREELQRRAEEGLAWLRSQLHGADSKSKLVFSPLVEEQEDQEGSTDVDDSCASEREQEAIIFDFDKR